MSPAHRYVALVGQFYTLPANDMVFFQNHGQLNAAYTGFSTLEIPAHKRLLIQPGRDMVYSQREIDGE